MRETVPLLLASAFVAVAAALPAGAQTTPAPEPTGGLGQPIDIVHPSRVGDLSADGRHVLMQGGYSGGVFSTGYVLDRRTGRRFPEVAPDVVDRTLVGQGVLTPDGRLALISTSTALDPADDDPVDAPWDLYVLEAAEQRSTLITDALDGSEVLAAPQISDDGTVVAYTRRTPGTVQTIHSFVLDPTTGISTPITGPGSVVPGLEGAARVEAQTLSGDGRWLVIDVALTVAPGFSGVALVDLERRTYEEIAEVFVQDVDIDADGSTVVFIADGDVMRYRRGVGLDAVTTDGTWTGVARLTADGRYVLAQSEAPPAAEDLPAYRRIDLVTGAQLLVGIDQDGGLRGGSIPSISDDGNWVAFRTGIAKNVATTANIGVLRRVDGPTAAEARVVDIDYTRLSPFDPDSVARLVTAANGAVSITPVEGEFVAGTSTTMTPVLDDGETVISLSVDPDGEGYWLFTDRGRVIPVGHDEHYGDLDGIPLNGPVIDSVATASGEGYYLVAQDGGVFAFGDAEFFGSMGGIPLNGPVNGLAPTSSGRGYWLVADDGGIFAFGDAEFFGSMGGIPLNAPVAGMLAAGDGYLLFAFDGGTFAFGEADFFGSLGGQDLPAPIVAVALRDDGDQYLLADIDGRVYRFDR